MEFAISKRIYNECDAEEHWNCHKNANRESNKKVVFGEPSQYNRKHHGKNCHHQEGYLNWQDNWSKHRNLTRDDRDDIVDDQSVFLP
jgi:hypothetical protein